MVFAFLAADFLDGVVDQADDMEFVEGDLGVGQACNDPLGEGLRHVGADFGDGLGIAAVGLEVFGESSDGGGVLARGGEQHLALLQIDEKGNVFLATPGGGFIHAALGDCGMVGFGAGCVHVVVTMRQIRVSCSLTRRASARTGMDLASITTNASNSKVKLRSALAQGTATRWMPQREHSTRAVRAWRKAWCWKKFRCRQVRSSVS